MGKTTWTRKIYKAGCTVYILPVLLSLILIFTVSIGNVLGATYSGRISWYCKPGVSRCTIGYHWSGPYAAAGPRLYHLRGKWVRVWYGSRSIRVKLIDTCAAPCSGYLIDLYESKFRELCKCIPRQVGVIRVRVTT